MPKLRKSNPTTHPISGVTKVTASKRKDGYRALSGDNFQLPPPSAVESSVPFRPTAQPRRLEVK